ncbi:L-type lectin-domain containing receptor kinase IV.1 [Apostasia shenzhenica]|uniref:non-specific serine/threonine protein kinase n=1 Tax=Apostasia shenzhenica TaxID=1088818 RepID=A0A2I0AA94_9ASPA|nr:L-type lectin-domain containing receptor kinase IV.1 [Apostasia shenzhenica]
MGDANRKPQLKFFLIKKPFISNWAWAWSDWFLSKMNMNQDGALSPFTLRTKRLPKQKLFAVRYALAASGQWLVREEGGGEAMLDGVVASFLLVMVQFSAEASAPSPAGFVFNGFSGSSLRLNGEAVVEPNGILRLTNTTRQEFGHAFYPAPFPFRNSSGGPLSFSTSFVFAIVPQYRDVSSHGIAFAVTPSPNLTAVLPSQHLGLFNLTNNGDSGNHILAVELDTIQNREFDDINDNHVGIDINGLKSLVSAPASFALDSPENSPDLRFENLSLISGQPLRLWVEYDGKNLDLNVTLAPLNVPKPHEPLLSANVNLSSIVFDEMYVGFSSSTGSAAGSHYILGWSFSMNGRAEELDLSHLPSLPIREDDEGKNPQNIWVIVLPIGITVLLLLSAVGIAILMKTRKKFAEVVEDWESEYGPHRFSYRDLYRATGGFSDDNILGNGGFGGVYRGLLPKSKVDIAVKRISHDSRQGMKEFVAEIASIGRLRHRNLVQLLGYCRRRGELLLVYDFMPNGSLDKYIFGRADESLGWSPRFNIIKGIAAGLLYLHEEWEKVVLHRDIKASNVLLDAEFNGKLGDFGLARLYDRGSNPQTTRVVGTLGYLAPELSRTGKSSTSSDVFAFGAFLLEVACGKKPVELKTSGIEMVLLDWVLELFKKGELLEARDRKLGAEFDTEEAEMVLKLGLICSHPAPSARPSMRQVVQYLDREALLPDVSPGDFLLLGSSSWSRIVTVGDSSSNSCTAPADRSSSPESPLNGKTY